MSMPFCMTGETKIKAMSIPGSESGDSNFITLDGRIYKRVGTYNKKSKSEVYKWYEIAPGGMIPTEHGHDMLAAHGIPPVPLRLEEVARLTQTEPYRAKAVLALEPKRNIFGMKADKTDLNRIARELEKLKKDRAANEARRKALAQKNKEIEAQEARLEAAAAEIQTQLTDETDIPEDSDGDEMTLLD